MYSLGTKRMRYAHNLYRQKRTFLRTRFANVEIYRKDPGRKRDRWQFIEPVAEVGWKRAKKNSRNLMSFELFFSSFLFQVYPRQFRTRQTTALAPCRAISRRRCDSTSRWDVSRVPWDSFDWSDSATTWAPARRRGGTRTSTARTETPPWLYWTEVERTRYWGSTWWGSSSVSICIKLFPHFSLSYSRLTVWRRRQIYPNLRTSTAKLERWIGGIFNWQQMAWEWGVTGEKMVFQSFGKMEPGKSERYAWHCIIMDPALKYKWSARSCVERKHYICEVPAGRLGKKCTRDAIFIHKLRRWVYTIMSTFFPFYLVVQIYLFRNLLYSVRRRKKSDPFAPQNQRLKPRKKGKKYSDEQRKLNERKNNRVNWRRNWVDQGENQQWANGVKLGSRPPKYWFYHLKTNF